ncbi:PspC domain-containing protein [Hymenobacter properus]|uniref:PspC domain-containing protein n=1 Tax=Hymenobacter properus TaxID=2791026 RepID=A0A931FH67_9BACT|nr:PspC domain-containing protein [Hymenobacter properus]MBF9140727.1 PspC domain-containing protein [Hymenobacter properus]MBR7719535.1 PspC domain-containing protein [Microvirga sp. SRT04]
MKKNISINLQGIIFHIEEDGFEVLSRYLAEVKAHFANYRGHEDIVSDIEGRIAELFSVRLSPMQQVITIDDVNAMVAKMGRVSDFATDDLDAEDVEETATAGRASAFGPEGAFGTKGPFGPEGTFGRKGPFGPEGAFGPGAAAADAAPAEPKRLYRDMAHRKIAGVAAGMAQYFAVNPVWVRLGWIALVFILPGLFGALNFTRGDNHIHFGGWAFLAYVILWILLPKRYDAPAPTDAMLNQGPLAGRKLFRDTGSAKIAGVAAGLGAYFNIDVTLVRVLLLAGLFAGGFTLMLYIILWIVLPEAKTVSDKLRMRGDDITLESFDSSARNNAFADGTATTNRPVGAFVEDAARNLRPAVNFVGSSIRIIAGILLTMVGFGCLVALAIALGAGIGLLPQSQSIVVGDAPAHVMLNGVPGWGLLAGFLVLAIPALSLLLSGLNLLFRISIMPRTVSLSLLGLWLLSVVGLVSVIAQQSREFQYETTVEQSERYPQITTPVIMLDRRHVDRQWEQHVGLRIVGVDSGKTVEVLRTMGAHGATEEVARRNALTTIDYTIRTSGDSSLVLDDHFSFLPDAKYRRQELTVTLRLPRDRTFRLSRDFAYDLLGDEDFVNDRRPEDPETHRYRLRGNKLECIACTDEQLGRDEDEDDSDVNINIDADNDEGDNNDEDNNRGATAFSTDLNSYGPDRRTFQETGFTRVSAVGGYRVVIRRGDSFKIEAGGDKDVLNDLRVELEGNELQIKPRTTSGSFLGRNWNHNERKALIRIEMPAVERLELAGGITADLGGFERQDRLDITQAGATALNLNGDYGTLKIGQAGACRTTATGHADELSLDAAMACELAAANLQARNADIDLAAACKARVNVTESLKGNAVGASSIAYSGNPKNVKVETVGASSVKRL